MEGASVGDGGRVWSRYSTDNFGGRHIVGGGSLGGAVGGGSGRNVRGCSIVSEVAFFWVGRATYHDDIGISKRMIEL